METNWPGKAEQKRERMSIIMKTNGERQFELLKKIGFIRTAGSEEELKAAEILRDEARSLGVSAEIEAFEIKDAEIQTAELEVLEPYRKSYTVTAYKCSENVEDLTAEFFYAENGDEVNLADAKGKIVLVNGFLRLPLYRRLLKAGVAGFVTMTGTLLDKEEETDLFTRKLRDTLLAFGKLPGVNLRISDAFELVTKKASKVRMTVRNQEVTLTSHNVVAEIKGTKYPEEIISFGAHYDSVPFSTGVYDNGAGSVINMEVLRYFAQHPPVRTVKFMWYGSEEIGLEGSKAYVRMHQDELKNHLFMINTDVGGPVLGVNQCRVTAGEELYHFAEYFMKTKGYAAQVAKGIYSSDSIPFADSGIPAVNFGRDGTEGGAFIHCRNDVIDFLSGDALADTADMVLDFADTLVNAVVFPVKREIPEDIRTEVDKYLFKKELEEAKEK